MVAKVDFGDRDSDAVAVAIDALEARVRAAIPHVRHIYVEHDRFDPRRISRGDAAPH